MTVVLVTGTSSGIGRACIPALVAAGCHVVATARSVSDIADLAGPDVDVLPLDVTDEASMEAAVAQTLERHGRIDTLVNNAGFGMYLSVEETSMEQMRALFEVNVFGPHRLTQLVLPHLRAAGRGRIVNVSSVAGHVSLPMLGPYSSTKFALRALTEALHMEVRPFGVHACLVEPGRVRTRFSARSRSETAAGSVPDGPYAGMQARFVAVASHERGAAPERIARRIVHACTARRPRFHYRAPLDAKAGSLARRLLPDAWLHRAIGAYLRPRKHRKGTP